MSSVAILTDAPGFIDIAAARFLPVGQMRQIARVTGIEGPVISGEMSSAPSTGCGQSTFRVIPPFR